MDVDDQSDAPVASSSRKRASQAAASEADEYAPSTGSRGQGGSKASSSAKRRKGEAPAAAAGEDDSVSIALAGVQLSDHPADAAPDAPLPVSRLLNVATTAVSAPDGSPPSVFKSVLASLNARQPSPSHPVIVAAILECNGAIDAALASDLARVIGSIVGSHGPSIVAGCAASNDAFDDPMAPAFMLVRMLAAIDHALRKCFGQHAGAPMVAVRAILDEHLVVLALVAASRGASRILGRPASPVTPTADSAEPADAAALLDSIEPAISIIADACAAEIGACAKGGPPSSMSVRLVRSLALVVAIVLGGAHVSYALPVARPAKSTPEFKAFRKAIKQLKILEPTESAELQVRRTLTATLIVQELWLGYRLMSPLVFTAVDEILMDAEHLDPLMGDRLIAPHRRSTFAHAYRQQLEACAPSEADAADQYPDPIQLADALAAASVAIVAQASTVLAQHLVAAVDPNRLFSVALDRAVSPPSTPPHEPTDRAQALLLALDSPGTTADALYAAATEAPFAPRALKFDRGHPTADDAVARAASAVARHLRRYVLLVGHDGVVDPARLSEICCVRIVLLATAALARSPARCP